MASRKGKVDPDDGSGEAAEPDTIGMPEVLEIRDIDSIIVNKRHRTSDAGVDALAENIRETGLLQAIVVTPNGQLVIGWRRLMACKRLGMKKISCSVVSRLADIAARLRAEAAENTQRMVPLISDMVALAEELLPIATEAAERRQAHVATTDGDNGKLPKKFSEAGEAMTQVAKEVGKSRPTLTEALAVTRAASDNPARYGDLIQRMDDSGHIHGAYIEYRRRMAADNPSSDEQTPTVKRQASMRLDKDGQLQRKGNLTDHEWVVLLEKLVVDLKSTMHVGAE